MAIRTYTWKHFQENTVALKGEMWKERGLFDISERVEWVLKRRSQGGGRKWASGVSVEEKVTREWEKVSEWVSEVGNEGRSNGSG